MRVAGTVLSRNADGIVDKTGLALFTIYLLNTYTLLLLGHGMVTPRVGTG